MAHQREPFSGKDMRQAEIAAVLGITCERVRQLEVSALKKLREALRLRNILSTEHIL